MKQRDYEAEAVDQTRRQESAKDKIDAQNKRMKSGHPTERQQADDQQLMNEMQVNKAAVDLNRALLDYDEEHKGDGHDM